MGELAETGGQEEREGGALLLPLSCWPVALAEAALLEGPRSRSQPLSPGYTSPWLPEALLLPCHSDRTRMKTPLLRGPGVLRHSRGCPSLAGTAENSRLFSSPCRVCQLAPPGSRVRGASTPREADTRPRNTIVSPSLPALTSFSPTMDQLLQVAGNVGVQTLSLVSWWRGH